MRRTEEQIEEAARKCYLNLIGEICRVMGKDCPRWEDTPEDYREGVRQMYRDIDGAGS